MAAPPLHAGGGAAEPWWCAALGPLGNCVRVPVLHDTIPGRAALPRLPALLPPGGAGRPLSPLRRGGDRRRSRRWGCGVMPLEKERWRGRGLLPIHGAPGMGFGFIASRAMVSRKGRGRMAPDPPLSPRPLGRRSGPCQSATANPRLVTVALSSAQARPLSHVAGPGSHPSSKEVLADHRPLATANLGVSNLILERSKQAYPTGWVGHSRLSKWANPGCQTHGRCGRAGRAGGSALPAPALSGRRAAAAS